MTRLSFSTHTRVAEKINKIKKSPWPRIEYTVELFDISLVLSHLIAHEINEIGLFLSNIYNLGSDDPHDLAHSSVYIFDLYFWFGF